MVQIGKNITWINATRETLSKILADSNAKINVTWISDTEANVFGDSVDLQNYKDFLETQGIIITVVGDVPIPPAPVPEPPPTQEELDNIQFQKEAYEEEIELERDEFWAKVQANYTAKGGTGTALRNGKYY